MNAERQTPGALLGTEKERFKPDSLSVIMYVTS